MKGIVIINKPSGWTSHDVVAKMRSILRVKRIGHGGTLDPMATGVLPLFVGRATRAVQFIVNADKEYIAGLRLGIETDTQDITGRIVRQSAADVEEEELIGVLDRMKGVREQIPPMYSAVKVNGKKLYEYARAGLEAKRAPRIIEIKEIELLNKRGGDYFLRIVCTKGTYIRTLCHEIGLELGCGGTLSTLIRTRAGIYTLKTACMIEQIAEAAKSGTVERFLRPVDSVFAEHEAISVTGEPEKKLRNGAVFDFHGTAPGRYRVYGEDGEFLALGEVTPDGMLKTVKSFFEI
ncbi:MAG: tRNA pseudouridine(55) synthase TruB [Clostridiales bacterium]|nr:tRNA pseudouridine(55) synthase TruB [Clostridiales bacterium]